MEKIKHLNTLIDQACSETHNQPPLNLYSQILNLVESRVDLPKHSITAISKKLTTKSKKILFITFDLLQYLSYNLQLPFFSQIATKQFLFKISGLMMNKETDPMIMDKILKLIKCLDELFRPLQDFLPLFFQFQAGLLRKQYQIPYDYSSPYRPKQLKQYKKPQKPQDKKKKPVIQPTKDEQKRFEEIRQKIILTNDIISNCDPSEDIRKNDLLLQLMEQLKQCEKAINQTIDQNPSEKILELALATNDDLVTTYRRYKDLQRNRKPETFFMAELASDIIKEQSNKYTKKAVQAKKPEPKIQNKPQGQKVQSIFQAFQISSAKKIEESKAVAPRSVKKEAQDIFDLVDNSEKGSDVTQITNAMDILDIGIPQNNSSASHSAGLNLDLLGGSNTQHQSSSNVADIFSVDLGLNQNTNSKPLQLLSQPSYQLPTYQQQPYQSGVYMQPVYQTSLYQQNLSQHQLPLNPGYLTQSGGQQPIYQNISLNLNTNEEKQKKEQKKDTQKQLTSLNINQFLF